MAAPIIRADGGLLLSTEDGAAANALDQGSIRQQIANLSDLVRQVVGNAAVLPGDGGPSDPLNAAFELYVDPVRGVDTFAHGEYNSFDPGTGTIDEQIEQKLRRISNQRMVCGYTPQRPFKTINRAAIEAAIITSRSWFINDPKTHVDCILIHLSAGVHVVYNDPGIGAVAAWPDGHEPTIAELIAFNPPEGGVIIPRYASIQGANLRKTTFRPNYVPPAADEADDYSNRSTFFYVTPNCLSFGFTFFDSWTEQRSHHLLDSFQFPSQAQLNDFYSKVNTACAVGADLDAARLVARSSEYNVVSAAIDQNNAPTEQWDVVASASPYIYNCSIRSKYGIGGIFADGDKVGGFKSMVTAQFTGVSKQTDLSCWEVYKGGSWVQPATYQEYIDADPDDVRMNPKRMSRHITAINEAFIQEVSVFAIGQAIHHYVDAGGEITSSNGNSSFGGCAAQARGYRSVPYPIDKNWNLSRIKRPLDLSEKVGNRVKIELGGIDDAVPDDAATIVLEQPLAPSSTAPDQPAVLAKDGFTLRPGTLIWARNSIGADFYATLADPAWDPAAPDEIYLTAPFTNEDGFAPGQAAVVGGVASRMPPLSKLSLYVRRLKDTRTKAERLCSIEIENSAPTRRPLRDNILQLDPADPSVVQELDRTTEIITITSSAVLSKSDTGVNTVAELTVRRGRSIDAWTPDTFYRAGDTVRYENKHFTCVRQHLSGTGFTAGDWQQSYVHMPSAYGAEDFFKNEGPRIVFDRDTDPIEDSLTLGYDLANVWNDDALVRNQYRSGVDYKGMRALLLAMGFSIADTETLLTPQAAAQREVDPGSGIAGISAPSGKVSGWGNWALHFYRPSTLNLRNHTWEWAGWLNYSKALPAVQRELGPQNKFTYYFTNENGGRVYAKGDNENGYTVTPLGLTDISTGEVESVENIGAESEGFDVSSLTSFDALAVNELTVQEIKTPGGGTLPNVEALIPKADTTTYGLMRTASSELVEDTLRDGISDPDDALRAITLAGVASIQAWALRLSGRLEVKYQVLYIDGGVQRAMEPDGIERATAVSVPPAIWTDIKANASLHEMGSWTGVTPEAGTYEYQFGRELVFNNPVQAIQFLAGRTLEENAELVFLFYGDCECPNATSAVYRTANNVVWQPGPSATLTGAKNRSEPVYLNDCEIKIEAPILRLFSLDVRSNDRANASRSTKRNMFNSSALAGSIIQVSNCAFTLIAHVSNNGQSVGVLEAESWRTWTQTARFGFAPSHSSLDISIDTSVDNGVIPGDYWFARVQNTSVFTEGTTGGSLSDLHHEWNISVKIARPDLSTIPRQFTLIRSQSYYFAALKSMNQANAYGGLSVNLVLDDFYAESFCWLFAWQLGAGNPKYTTAEYTNENVSTKQSSVAMTISGGTPGSTLITWAVLEVPTDIFDISSGNWHADNPIAPTDWDNALVTAKANGTGILTTLEARYIEEVQRLLAAGDLTAASWPMWSWPASSTQFRQRLSETQEVIRVSTPWLLESENASPF